MRSNLHAALILPSFIKWFVAFAFLYQIYFGVVATKVASNSGKTTAISVPFHRFLALEAQFPSHDSP